MHDLSQVLDARLNKRGVAPFISELAGPARPSYTTPNPFSSGASLASEAKPPAPPPRQPLQALRAETVGRGRGAVGAEAGSRWGWGQGDSGVGGWGSWRGERKRRREDFNWEQVDAKDREGFWH